MTELQNEFGTKGIGYAGVDLYAGGKLTAETCSRKGLKSGDEAMVYGVFSQAERGQSEKGLADTLEKAGLKVDRLEITPGGEQRRLARRAGSRRLHPEPSEPEGDRHPARRHHRADGPRCCRRPASSRARSSSAASTSARRRSTG